jgi:hypothetical protein
MDLVRIWSGTDAIQAELIRGRLEVEGIPVLHKGDGEGPYRAGPVHILVRKEDEPDARAIIDAVMSGAFELPEGEIPVQDRSTNEVG